MPEKRPAGNGPGNDIFISYAREDEERVRPLASALEQKWSVFWDRQIPPGHTYRTWIVPALAAARCVVVVWSRHSVESDWVIEEAGEARRRGTRLFPVRVDPVDPPLGFREIHFADLAGHDLDRASPKLRSLVKGIDAVLEAGAAAGPRREPRSRRASPRSPRGPGQSSSSQIVKVGEVRFPGADPKARAFRNKSTGPREISVPVTFDVPFSRPPAVTLGLRELDLGDAKANIHRISVRAENVQAGGFDLYFATWLESQVYGAVASWIAVGD
jgi:TIR domain-containing protein/H-type lectin domain-containing protein